MTREEPNVVEEDKEHMLTYRYKGNFKKTKKVLTKIQNAMQFNEIETFGKKGVEALVSATPRNTGLTAESWYYKVEKNDESIKLSFCNSNIQDGIPVAFLIYYGHGTRNGGYVQGYDYINPALDPLFKKVVNDAWKEVTNI